MGMRLIKATALAVSLSLLIAISALAFERPATQANSFEKYLPDSTMILFSITDIGKLREFASDPELQNIFDLTGIGDYITNFKTTYSEEFKEETGMSPSDLLDALAGDITLAILDSDLTGVPNIVIFAKVDPERFPFDRLIELAIEQAGEENVIRHDIGGVSVTQVGKDTLFAMKDDHAFIASSLEAMSAALKPETALADSPLYRLHKEMTGMSGGIVGYINLSMFLERLKPFLPDPESAEGRNVDLFLDMFGARKITSVSMLFPIAGEGPFRFFIHAPGYNGILTKLFSGEPVDRNCVNYVPADFDSFFAASIQKPYDIFNSILEEVERFYPAYKASDFDANIKPIEDQLGISIKNDFLAPLGTAIGGGIKINPDAEYDISAGPQAVFNLFQFVFYLQLDDPDRFLQAMKSLTNASNGEVSVSEYKGATLFTMQPPMFQNSIDFAIHGHAMLLCFGTDTMKGIIDAAETSNSIATTAEFKDRYSKVPKNAWYIAYNADAYLKKLFRGFFKQILAIRTNDEEKASTLVEAVLNYAGEHTGGIGFSTISSEGLYMESRIPIRAAVAMIPIYISWFAIESFSNIPEFQNEEYNEDEEYYEEDEYEEPEPPQLHPLMQ
jgi:hypothetical protein